MVRIVLNSLILLLFCCGVTQILFASENHMISAELQKNTYIFGEPVQLTIKYTNNRTNDWTMEKPDESFSTGIYYKGIGNPRGVAPYSFGKIVGYEMTSPDGTVTGYADSIIEPDHIIIRPGEQYMFVTDLPGIFPGKWIMWAEYAPESLKTVTSVFQAIFTKKSADILLGIAKKDTNEDLYSYNRKQSVKYLREFKTNMPKLKWPRYDDTPEQRKRKEILIQKQLKIFEKFWNTNKNTPDIDKVIERINKVCREITESSSRKRCPDFLEFRR